MTISDISKMRNALHAGAVNGDIVYGIKVEDLHDALEELLRLRHAMSDIKDAIPDLD